MFEFGAEMMEFSNVIEGDLNSDSLFFKNNYLLVDGEVLFYEDIYELLIDETKFGSAPDRRGVPEE